MDTTKFTPQSVVKLDMLNEDQLLELAGWCKARSADLEWERVKLEAAERDAKWKRQWAEEEAQTASLVAKLQKVIKPGMRLKMKGCRDGLGLREFIRWDGNNLVCWQICRRISFVGGDSRKPRQEEWNSNQVTTHMPDKVQEIYVDGTAMKVRSILK